MTHQTTDREAFAKIVGNTDRWASIGDLVDLCDSAGFWTPEFISDATTHAKKATLRRLIKQQRDESGWPVWASVEKQDENGKTVRVYKQETLFDVDDYRQMVSYHVDRTNYNRAMAVGYARRCKKRFNKQISFHFA